MSILQFLVVAVYTIIVLSLIWARFNFFKINSFQSRTVSYFNDPAVAVQLICTYKAILSANSLSPIKAAAVVFAYLCSLLLFWWAIRSSRNLAFAAEDSQGNIFTEGAFSLVRHPFYLSYMIVWFASTLLFGSLLLWLSLCILVVVYTVSAKLEEERISSGDKKEEYLEYQRKVRKFLPIPKTNWL